MRIAVALITIITAPSLSFHPDHNGHLERIATELTASLAQKTSGSIKVFPDPKLQTCASEFRRPDDPDDNNELLVLQRRLIVNMCQSIESAPPTDDAVVVLIKVAEFVQLHSAPALFQFVHRLTRSETGRRPVVFLWVNEPCLLHGADEGALIVPYLESMAGLEIRLRDTVNMSLAYKKPAGGSVVKKLFSYEVNASYGFEVRAIEKEVRVVQDTTAVNPESLTTFKINVDDDEQEARTALKLPYERTSEKPPQESKIIYHPDADDDFDEEDPDDDLNI